MKQKKLSQKERIELIELLASQSELSLPSTVRPFSMFTDKGLMVYSETDAEQSDLSGLLAHLEREEAPVRIDVLVKQAIENGGYDLGHVVRAREQLRAALKMMDHDIANWEDNA